MFPRYTRHAAFFAGVALLLSSSTIGADERPSNVLFIAVDDLRPELGCYGGAQVHSPNIDAFAASGRLFERAYCQQAVCNPSRSSLMTGMRPDAIGVTGNHSHFRTINPDIVTLPQHFKQHGYHAAAIGKIYHGVFPDGASNTKWDTMGDPVSWSVPAVRFGPRYYYTEEGISAAKETYKRVYRPEDPAPDDWTEKLVFGPATEAPDVPDHTLYDGKVADAAVKTLQQFKTKDKPFFLAVGFIKPHSPYIAPKKYFDLYDDVALPTHTKFPAGAPRLAGHGSGELRRYTDQPKSGVIDENKQRRVRHAYYACISYIDAQIGRVLAELDRSGLSKNTIVVLFSDHGYHLGEQGLWGKTTNFELDTRVPLIVRTPGMNAPGKTSSSMVELVDLYPTLAQLTGLPIPAALEGKSFAAAVNDPNLVTKTTALSQYPRGGGLMGYSMRTPTHRLTQWVHRQTGEIRETELYDYSDGLIETENLASQSTQLVENLAVKLQAAFGLDPGNSESIGGISFEEANPGPFEKLEIDVGTWTPEVGRTIVDDKHAKSGKQCLQLTGGEQTSVVFQLSDSVDTSGVLSFWAERWTSRDPFTFRIDKHDGKKWQEIYNGDDRVRVGRSFLNHVTIPLADEQIEQLRFTASSPPNTGILIDDLRIAPVRPQKIVSVEVVPLTLPALVGTESSRLVKLKVVTSGSLNPLAITGLKITPRGDSTSTDFKKLFVHPNRWEAKYAENPWTLSKSTDNLNKDDEEDPTYEYRAPQKVPAFVLAEGENEVWLSCRLRENADIDQRLGAHLKGVGFSNGTNFDLNAPPTLQRLGVAVRKKGDDGNNTYRIPGLATTNEGTLISVYDVRRRTSGDLPGDIEVGMSRSTDGGRTWEPMKVIMDMGDDPKWHYDGVGDPAVLVDRNSGTIWVAATWSHGNRSWRGSGPGLTPEETGQFMLARSDDDGVTWSKPINITKQIKDPKWCFILQGPGKGITMRDGTIVFAAQYQDPPEQKRLPHSTIIYSKDHGKTWQVGTGAFDDTTEAQVVEVEPGVLMLNCRYNRKSVRVVMTTRDMGKTWQKHTTSERSLIEPGSCMASLIDVDQEVGKDVGNWLLFSNPDSTHGRHHITIKASSDRGLTWAKEHRLLLDEGKSAGYSCMTMIDENTVGILYEGSQAHMTFQRIPLNEIVDQSKQQKSLIKPMGQLKLPRVFGSNMVLQANSAIPIWGSANPGEKVSVSLGSEKRVANADESGEWHLRLSARKANATPAHMSVTSGGETIQFENVLIGEVWVCAGQSNMEWELSQSANAKNELFAADRPSLRLLNLVGGARGSSGSYQAEHLSRLKSETFCEGEWNVASDETAGSFSAVAWYFGNYLQEQLQVPIGLICPAVGGTPTEAWIPQETLQSDPNTRGLVAGNWLDNPRLGEFCRTRGEQNLLSAIQAGESIPKDEFGPNHSFKPGFMWDAGIEPLIPFAIQGVIWYQGESNAETPARVREHGRLFPLLVTTWREEWGRGDFPFLYVQLPALNRAEWPWFRDGQRRSLDELDNVGMAITIDTGHPSNVHPTLKRPAGARPAHTRLLFFLSPAGPPHFPPCFWNSSQIGSLIHESQN